MNIKCLCSYCNQMLYFRIGFTMLFWVLLPIFGLAQPTLSQQKLALVKVGQYCNYMSQYSEGDTDALILITDLLEYGDNDAYDDITGSNKLTYFTSLLKALSMTKGKYSIQCYKTTLISGLTWIDSEWPEGNKNVDPADIIVVPLQKTVNGQQTNGVLFVRAVSGKIMNYFKTVPAKYTILSFNNTPVRPPVYRPEPQQPSNNGNYTETVNGVGFDMIAISGGTFSMGQPDPNIGGAGVSKDEQPVHRVTVDRFYMGKTEVTVTQFKSFIDATSYQTDADKDGGSYFWTDKWEKRAGTNWRCDADGNIRSSNEYDHPVIHVSWNDAVAYCEWLSRKTGKSYRLPTEAEWEFAAGNGPAHTKYSWGNENPQGKNGGNVADESKRPKDGVAWSTKFEGYNDGYWFTAPVGTYNPNEFGLYDMTGNVYEWCSDWYGSDYYANSPQTNPKGAATGSYRVLRGGGWNLSASDCRVSFRHCDGPAYRGSRCGFRLVCSF